eukprot:11612-Eustigmatos_ZCMA.PRE.1
MDACLHSLDPPSALLLPFLSPHTHSRTLVHTPTHASTTNSFEVYGKVISGLSHCWCDCRRRRMSD